MLYCLDIETTTTFDRIRMVGVREEGVKGKFYCIETPEDLLFVVKTYLAYNTVTTWNGSAFDFPMIEKLWGIDMIDLFKDYDTRHIDGYILSKIAFNDRKSHSLESYAQEFFGSGKLVVDYDTCTLANLAAYCEVDCDLTMRVVRKLSDTLRESKRTDSIKKPLKLEQHVARLIKEQEFRGFTFDVEGGIKLAHNIETTMKELEAEAETWLPIVPLPATHVKHPPKIQFKKDGSFSHHMVNYCIDNGLSLVSASESETGEAYATDGYGRRYKLPLTEPLKTHKKLSLSNQTELKKYLLDQGWKPTIWNTKKVGGKSVETSPRLTDPVSKEPCPNLYKVLDPEKSAAITQWLTLRSRKNIILSDNGTGLVRKANDLVNGKGIIHHSADTLGTPTGRFIHRDIVNIPRVGSTLGAEVRHLFKPAEGFAMVGWDASSLEACMEAHYVYPFDKDYADEIMDGDIHTKNQKALGLPDRATAKTFKYAITYGAQPARLASSLSVPHHVAKDWYAMFWDNNVGLKRLKQAIEKDWESKKSKYITGLDGRWLQTRSQHSLLNTKLQGAGAVVMKYAMVLAESRIKAICPQANALIRYHDEEQWECPFDFAEEIGKIGVQSIADAGEILQLNVPLTGEYKVGTSWAETH